MTKTQRKASIPKAAQAPQSTPDWTSTKQKALDKTIKDHDEAFRRLAKL